MVKIKKIIMYFILFIIFLFLGRLFGGVFEDDEFNDRYFFIKNTPSWKWHFYSPSGMSDLELKDMSKEQREEQLMYDKFIQNRLLSFPIWKK